MSINDYIRNEHGKLKGEWEKVVPRVKCVDGFSMSVQASDSHYCDPRENKAFQYLSMEIGYPSEKVKEFMPYSEDYDDPTGTVYGRVPVEVIDAVIEQHGGINK